MVAAADDLFGNMTQALRVKKMYKDSLIVMSRCGSLLLRNCKSLLFLMRISFEQRQWRARFCLRQQPRRQ
jgi:hypothetical protein